MFVFSGCADIMAFIIPPPTRLADSEASRMAPDLVLDHVRLAEGATQVSIAIRAGRIAEVGPNIPASRTSSRTRRLDLQGAVVEPNVADAHIHLAGTAMLADAILVQGVETRDAFCERLRQSPSQLGSDWQWVVGASRALFASLDPAALPSCDEKRRWVASAPDGHGLRLSPGAVALLPDPLRQKVATAGGRVEGAMARDVWRRLPPPRRQRLGPLMVKTLRELAERGIGEVHAMGESVATLRVLRDLARRGRVPIRVYVYLDAHDPEIEAALSDASRTPSTGRPPLVAVAGAKVWLDGTLGGKTAAMRAPYADDASGEPYDAKARLQVTDDALRGWVERLDRLGLQLAVHAIGDAAVEQLLRVSSAMQRPADARPIRLEHAQTVGADQLQRLSGLLCSIQPLHRLQDLAMATPRLGNQRISDGWRAASLAKVCPLLVGSDLPISAADPTQWRAELLGRTEPPRAENERLTQAEVAAALLRDPFTGRLRRVAVGANADLMAHGRGQDAPSPDILIVDGQVRIIAPRLLRTGR
ncbi:MAG: amidohydrolase family protein [Deltaproteobacteria bacterium]|nr:amidohydrolase family protein [Deltaproteobacteria bacterium]